MKPIKPFIFFFLLLIHFHSSSQQVEGTIEIWEATIGKGIKASVSFSTKDSVIVGEIRYQKTNQPIKLRGTLTKNDGYRILEFEPSGNITGIITATRKDGVFSGTWFSPKTRRELPLVLNLKKVSLPNKTAISKPAAYRGVYRYGYSEEGDQGYFALKRINATTAEIEFQNTTAGPAYNQATIDPVKVPMKNNQIIHRMYKDCIFRIRFYNDIAVVDYVANQYNCLFGNNASVDGVYLRVKE